MAKIPIILFLDPVTKNYFFHGADQYNLRASS